MKKKYISPLFAGLLLLCQTCFATTAEVTIGDQTITIPAPTESYMDMPELVLQQALANTPPQNNFLCGFLDTNDLSQNTAASVQSLIQLDSMNISQEMFSQMTAQTRGMVGDVSFEEAMKEYTDGMQNVSVGQPHVLGILLDAPDRFTYAMEMTASVEGNSTRLVIGTGMLNIKGKVLLITLVHPYNEGHSLEILKPQMESWIQAIVDAN
jgi:hypothetical protein